MALSKSRIEYCGETPHVHEREAIAFVAEGLPDQHPFHAWALVELLEPSTGRLYEIDMIVMGYSALYLVEIKSGPGTYDGDHQDWYRTDPVDSVRRYLENPYRLANHKAKVLASRLRYEMKRPPPRVEALVFLSHPETKLALDPVGMIHVLDRSGIHDALKRHKFPGSPDNWQNKKIEQQEMVETINGLKRVGLQPRKGRLLAGQYQLGDILQEGPGFQDRTAKHRESAKLSCRARVYLVPEQTSAERRRQLQRAAKREVELLMDVREHPNVLRFHDYVAEAPLGPTVLLDAFEGGVPLDVFLRKRSELPFDQRVAIVEQVGRALASCHKRGVIHGSVSPTSVLVRERDGAAPEVRLFNFQGGLSGDVEGTSHLTSVLGESWTFYQAPELRDDPSARSEASDLFGLGALAYFVFTGRAPAEDGVALVTRLASEGHLDPRQVSDSVPQPIADLIISLTQLIPANRGLVALGDHTTIVDDPDRWIDELVKAARPVDAASSAGADPLEAQAGDVLDGGLEVLDVLGHGSTSRVLKVSRPGESRPLALKVPLNGHEARVAEEGQVLDELRSEHIVAKVDAPTVRGRQCLLLTLAGSETLHRLLVQEGPLSLEDLATYGEDLLLALELLEAKSILHRDIKPANLGVGTTDSKKKKRLMLFDFSLTRARLDDLNVGTAVYRDPFLFRRGSWDEAADRYSAAVTLYEMATGLRPTLPIPSADPTSRVVFQKEPFDPSVRAGLSEFFEQAFEADAAKRFASAESMRHAFHRAVHLAPKAAKAETLAYRLVHDDEPIEALPLSPAARNALDRAGLTRASELLSLPENRLSALRGVGSRIAKEVLEFRERWRSERGGEPPSYDPFFPGYMGDDLPTERAGFGEMAASVLVGAGLTTLRAIADAPRQIIERLMHDDKHAIGSLRAVLSTRNNEANERERPTSIESFIAVFLPKKAKGGHVRELYGLDGPFAGRLDVRVSELAKALTLTAPAIYIELGKMREKWTALPALDALRTRAESIVSMSQGALPLFKAADMLRGQLAHNRSRPGDEVRVEAAALLQIVAETDKTGPFRVVRPHSARGNRQPWVVDSSETLRELELLGDEADKLAARDVPPAAAEAQAALVAVLKPSSRFAALPADRLLEIAAEASSGAACSARLEIYPRGMPPARSLGLTAAQLNGIDEGRLREVVAQRYPEAAPLPDRPALDELVEELGFSFNAMGQLARGGEADSSSLATHMLSPTSQPSKPVKYAALPNESELQQADFDDALKLAVEHRTLRVVAVSAELGPRAVRALAVRLGVTPQPLDQLVTREMAALIQSLKIDPRVVHAADRAEDRKSPAWGRLRELARRAADQVEKQLLPAKGPLLLAQPGLLARYDLEKLLVALLEAGRDPAQPAVFLVVPSRATPGVPAIEGRMSLPGVLASQLLRVKRSWLEATEVRAA